MELSTSQRAVLGRAANNLSNVLDLILMKELIKHSNIPIPQVEAMNTDTNEQEADDDENMEDEKEQEELLDSELFRTESYFIFTPLDKSDEQFLKTSLVKLNPETYKKSNEILSNSDAFLEKNSVLNNIHQKILAPNINKKLEQKYTNYISKSDSQKDKRLATKDEIENKRKQEKKKSNAGKGWYNMEAPDMTPELKQQVMALRLQHATKGGRDALEEDITEENLPQFFQVGTLVEGPTEYFSQKSRKRDRKQNILDQVIHDAKQSSSGNGNYVDKRYKEIMEEGLTSAQAKKKRKMDKRK